jgi:two-component system LytT family response regulator
MNPTTTNPIAMTSTTMPPIRALIVDDEMPGRINLRYALAEHANWQVVAECASADAARQALEQQATAQQPVDVVFLDIQMPRENGIALAHSLCQQSEPPIIIFVTAYHAFALAAFEVHALDYLLKPFDDQRLAKTLERAAALLQQRQKAGYGAAVRGWVKDAEQAQAAAPGSAHYWQQVAVRSVGQIECIRLDQVAWISSAGNYVELHLDKRVVLHRQPLSQLAEHLDPAQFIRVHRTALVRISQAVSLASVGDGSFMLTLAGGDQVPVSERYVAGLRGRMGTA